MTVSIKENVDERQSSRLLPMDASTATSSSQVQPPPPYSNDLERGVTNVNERRPLYPTNSGQLPLSNPAPLTHTSPSSKRILRAMVIFVICLFVLSGFVKKKRHQIIHDGLAWADLTPSNRCLRYSTREYSAQLMGVPSGEDGLRWCKEKEITIHSVDFEKPGYCTVDVDDSAPTNPRIYGHWTVESNEPSCKTLWEDFQDKGCVAKGSKRRRIEAHMGNHQPPWDNWREMCSTTPVDYGGYHFDQPNSCDHRGIFSGVWGVWFVKDESC